MFLSLIEIYVQQVEPMFSSVELMFRSVELTFSSIEHRNPLRKETIIIKGRNRGSNERITNIKADVQQGSRLMIKK